jgi:hypothetical protein
MFTDPFFLDGVGVNAIEVHGHGTASAEGVATDVAFGVAKVVEANLASRLFEGGVDVLGSYGAPGGEKGVFETEEACGWGAVIAEDVVDTAGQGVDGTVDGASAFLVDALALDTVFLVRHSNGGFRSSEEGRQW